MASNLRMTWAELHEITDYKQHCKQGEWLAQHGYPVAYDKCGRVMILRHHFEPVQTALEKGATDEPDYEVDLQ